MTAQVGVMNKLGVALATDSAVSLGPDATKIYPSAEKLFQLLDGAPVGAMVYGNADFVQMPWETIIKAFRADRRGKTCPGLDDYGKEVLLFLQGHKGLFPDPMRDASVVECVEGVLLQLRGDVRDRLEDVQKVRGKVSARDVQVALRDVARDGLAAIRKVKRLPVMTGRGPSLIRANHGAEIDKAIGRVFGTVSMGKQTRARIVSIVCEALSREWFGEGHSGLVIAGFGDDEYMPRLVEIHLQGMVLGAPRFKVARRETVSDQNGASVNAFAQSEMVYAFMEGIDRMLNARMRESAKLVLKRVVEAVVDRAQVLNAQVGMQLRTGLTGRVDRVVDRLFKYWKQMGLNYWGPVLEIVGALPKDELGSMAEALVNLTKFRRHVTVDKETVGGPIDVAVITKGDGFVWLRRKHYFDPDLNPRVVARYWR